MGLALWVLGVAQGRVSKGLLVDRLVARDALNDQDEARRADGVPDRTGGPPAVFRRLNPGLCR